MAALRKLVVDPCVRRHFHTTMTPGPTLRSRKKAAPDTTPAIGLGNKPALEVTHRARWIATIGVRAQVDFGKAGKRAICGLGDEIDQRHCAGSVAGQYRFQLPC